jgi:hypothetical protein
MTGAEGQRAKEERPSRWVRAFVAAFLAAFAVCGVFGIEAWPLTGWRLFSHLRTDQQVSWRAVAVDGRGSEEAIHFERLPRGYRNFPLVMRGFSSLPPRKQAAACRAWLAVARHEMTGVEAVRIYRIDWYLSYRHGSGDGPPPTQTLLYTCIDEAASDASA